MGRIHLFEIEDQPWCPIFVRDGITDLLQFHSRFGQQYKMVAPILKKALARSRTSQVVDLCSGGGGPWLALHPLLQQKGLDIDICLTDWFPNQEAFNLVQEKTQGRVRFFSEPVDATNVPKELSGFRTLFASFHHFQPDQARAILADAVRQGQGIGVFEFTRRSPEAMIPTFFAPVWALFATPFIRPFRWSRLAWTYLIPAIPMAIGFDGLVSCLRTYSPKELEALTQGLDTDGYTWEIGVDSSFPSPLQVTWLVGYPG